MNRSFLATGVVLLVLLPAVALGAVGEPLPHGVLWANTASILGLVGGGVAALTALASEFTKENLIPSLPLGGVSLLHVAVLAPVVNSGGVAARRATGVEGQLALRITGWVAYGLTLAGGTGLVAMGILEVTPPDMIIASVGVIGMATLICFSTDARICYQQATGQQAAAPVPHRPRVNLVLAPLASAGGSRGAALVVTGQF